MRFKLQWFGNQPIMNKPGTVKQKKDNDDEKDKDKDSFKSADTNEYSKVPTPYS